MDKINTKNKIKHTALELFNRFDSLSVSLNTIAKEMEISLGNLRYHYKTKAEIIRELYLDMQKQFEVNNTFELFINSENPLQALEKVFDKSSVILWEYRFIMRDAFVLITIDSELKNMFLSNREKKMQEISTLLKYLANEKIIKPINQNDIELRSKLHWFIPAYWQIFASTFHSISEQSFQETKTIIFQILLFPYLTKKGKEMYKTLDI